MALTFRLALHRALPDVQVVEVLHRGEICGVIYPDGPKGMKIISAHFAGDLAEGENFPDSISMDNGERTSPPIPSVSIEFDPRPFSFQSHKIVRS